MDKIRIGTCIPGNETETYLTHLMDAGFECFSMNFHMVFEDKDLRTYAEKLKRITDGRDLPISTIGYYCNALQYEEHRKTLEHFIDNAHLFGTNIVTTFAGALEGESVDAAMPTFKQVFGELAKRAEEKGVKLAIENCPMSGTWQKATCNIGFNPKAWEMMFQEVDSPALGLEWEPAHQMIQLIDPIPQLEKWVGKVYHVHGKDTTINWTAVKEYGVFGAKEFAVERTPGYGDTDWRDVFHVLYTNGFTGDICVEGFHDPVFGGEREMAGQLHALKYLDWCRGGNEKNPW